MLQVVGPLFLVGTLLWSFISIAEMYALTVPVLVMIYVLTGVSAAGVTLASNNISLKLAPKGNATAFLAAMGVAVSITGVLAPLLGGLLANFFAERELYFIFTWSGPEGIISLPTIHFAGLDFLFLISVVLGLIGLHRLAFVKEPGETEEKVVIAAILAETRHGVRLLSSVEGLRHAFHLPISSICSSLTKVLKNHNDTRDDDDSQDSR